MPNGQGETRVQDERTVERAERREEVRKIGEKYAKYRTFAVEGVAN